MLIEFLGLLTEYLLQKTNIQEDLNIFFCDNLV